ncbi:hypothetical protein Ciccas_011592 [Cichlidogyrus casuarinus]|uniref:RING-type domain-containing protein n=1 Tax=Cichlidogyrus casuarinus TaxID=1844966 RepID=A0ABD2PRZ9_9PLAT
MPDVVKFFIDNPSFAFAYGALAKIFEIKKCEPNYKLSMLEKLITVTRNQYNSPKVNRDLLKVPKDPKSIDVCLACPFCRSLLNYPVVLSCGKAFCESCISDGYVCHLCPNKNNESVNPSVVLNKTVAILYPELESSYRSLRLASQYHKSGLFRQSLELTDQVLENFPANTLALYYRAECYLSLNDPCKALEDAETIQKLNPCWPKYYLIKGIALKRMARYSDAIECLFAGFSAFPYSDRCENEMHLNFPLTLLDAIPKTSWTLPVILHGCCMETDDNDNNLDYEFIPNRGNRCNPQFDPDEDEKPLYQQFSLFISLHLILPSIQDFAQFILTRYAG